MNDTDIYRARVPRDLKPEVDALVRLHTGGGTREDVETLTKALATYSLLRVVVPHACTNKCKGCKC